MHEDAKENVSESLLSKAVCAVFPNAKKSNIRIPDSPSKQVKRKNSFRGLGINIKKKQGAELPFKQLVSLVPSDYFVISHTDSVLILGKLSDECFNGNPVLSRVEINPSGECKIYVGDSRIDLKNYFIRPTIKFCAWSFCAFFRCLNTIRLCCGYESDRSTGGIVGVTECYTHTKQTFKKSVLRHIYCERIVSLQANTDSCRKCSSLHYRAACKNEDATPDSPDICSIIRGIAPNIGENQLLLIESQLKSSNMSKYGMRWPKELISMSLGIYNRNPSSYRLLSQNGWLNLPSERLLSVYKNAVQQKPGIVTDMMQWMQQEALRQNVPPHGMYGGLIMDEMSIQEDLVIASDKTGQHLVGLSDSGKECFLMNSANSGCLDRQLANHVLQYFFHGLSGFRWPFANYPNNQASPAELFVTAWKCIEALEDYGFHVVYCCMDGSSNNRAFLKMHFPTDELLSTNMCACHFKNPKRRIIFMMDPCHLLKKIRNGILSSGFKDFHTRILTLNGKVIVWEMWVNAYFWDRNNPFPIHRKLTDEHLFPNNAQKMRNKLAFDVLDQEMLHLMQTYNASLKNQSEELEAAIVLLEKTSFLADFFQDNRPIKDLTDARLKKFSDVYDWFKTWEKSESREESTNKRHKGLLTLETREDIDFLYHGFMSLVEFSVTELKYCVVPSRINSDVIENVFCQQRSLYHGATTNPTYNAYRQGINSVVLGQSTISKKSNAACSKAEPFAKSLKLPR